MKPIRMQWFATRDPNVYVWTKNRRDYVKKWIWHKLLRRPVVMNVMRIRPGDQVILKRAGEKI